MFQLYSLFQILRLILDQWGSFPEFYFIHFLSQKRWTWAQVPFVPKAMGQNELKINVRFVEIVH